ncbi:MAG TPA: hypothetical protein VGK84_05790, partial [Candidatus Tumulicola sp.]
MTNSSIGAPPPGMQVSDEAGTPARFGTFYQYRSRTQKTSEDYMYRTFARTLALIGIAALAACQGAAGGGMMPSQSGGVAAMGAQ